MPQIVLNFLAISLVLTAVLILYKLYKIFFKDIDESKYTGIEHPKKYREEKSLEKIQRNKRVKQNPKNKKKIKVRRVKRANDRYSSYEEYTRHNDIRR